MMRFNKHLICVTGLPRSGSTLLCQILSHHPEIYSPGHSSPLCQIIVELRRYLSDNKFFLSQLDADFELTYRRLENVNRGLLNGWFAETELPWVVDKNRGWLHHLETIHSLVPDVRMLVCVRELGQIYGSIEAQHQKTPMLDFPDHLAELSRYDRADKLFASAGVIGSPLRSIEALQDVDEKLQKQLFYVVFEHLMREPKAVLQSIYDWLGLKGFELDLNQLQLQTHESDSYYRFKYRHDRRSQIQAPSLHVVPRRIQTELIQNFGWYYKLFYPEENNHER
jgi:sulfotransferase